MSGLNPFRPKKPESEVHPPLPNVGHDGAWRPRAVPPNPSPSSVSTNSYYTAAPLTAGSLTNSSATPHGHSETPPESWTSDADNSQTSDDPSLPDPFQKSSHMSDNDVDEGEDLNDGAWKPSYSHRSTPAGDRRHSAFSIAPHSTPFPPGPVISTPTTALAPSGGPNARTDSNNRLGALENQRNLQENTMNATPSAPVPISAPRGVPHTGSGTATIPRQHTVAPSSEFEMGPKPLAVRSANRDKKPPPPPKSHHGKLINPSPHATSSQSQSIPARPTKRFSYHGTSSETSLSLTPDTPPSGPSQPRIDYFTPLDDNPSPQSETLRRSQSQHKRPPTPPLSRRHSQMRRSKSTMSRTNLSRLSMAAGKIEVNASPPPSPGPRTQEPRIAPPMPDEAGPSSGQCELPSSRRASQVNPLPPPPPPRRNRVSSSHSNSRSQPTLHEQEKRAEDEDFIPRPSNANDILADLSRLQKEVDDLRGHYESRKLQKPFFLHDETEGDGRNVVPEGLQYQAGIDTLGTTSLSALSTTAIKDGHQGQPLPHGRHAHHSSSASATSTSTLEAERADRISRLAGLERVATARAGGVPQSNLTFATAHGPGYFDSGSGFKERSTVGSASATGSVGARTTWASGSDALDADKMSEDTNDDDGTSSVGNISEGDVSLVAFGEGASTISGPISHPGLNRMSSGGRPSSLGAGSPSMSRANPLASSQPGVEDNAAMSSSLSPAGSNTPEQIHDARMLDGMTYDSDVVDTTVRTPRLATPFSQGQSANRNDDSGIN
ncbi:uncharacterized protein CDV56_102686 [Aspergillus thermomutatus]|uniref:Uncharacterized protein n=1 Tax=Aspergillus thermomutatus TaxID=41047 RepID=A0A397HB44_ASPTH|nr:uncharacterized protein CDV56_102686 [Aspergillus thermomutatus]RHZ57610.1 hypothetical protein CDV56_102686 [Aspergillus thermomutatus]